MDATEHLRHQPGHQHRTANAHRRKPEEWLEAHVKGLERGHGVAAMAKAIRAWHRDAGWPAPEADPRMALATVGIEREKAESGRALPRPTAVKEPLLLEHVDAWLAGGGGGAGWRGARDRAFVLVRMDRLEESIGNMTIGEIPVALNRPSWLQSPHGA